MTASAATFCLPDNFNAFALPFIGVNGFLRFWHQPTNISPQFRNQFNLYEVTALHYSRALRSIHLREPMRFYIAHVLRARVACGVFFFVCI